MKTDLREESNLAGPCGIFCGLCIKYQSKAPSRCLGCRLGEQHSWCSIYRCCVMKKEFATCLECEEYPCERYSRRGWEEDQQTRVAQDSLNSIKKAGIESWLYEQKERRLAVEELLDNYNDGRSMSFYCLACTLMPVNLINQAVDEMKQRLSDNQIDNLDMKAKAKALRAIIHDLASESGIDLKPKNKQGNGWQSRPHHESACSGNQGAQPTKQSQRKGANC